MAWSDIFIPAGNQSSNDATANIERLKGLNQDSINQRNAAGALTDSEANQLRAQIDAIQPADQNAAAAQGFSEGLSAGLSNVLGAPGSLIGKIPVSLWLIGGVALFVYLGGLEVLKGIIKRKAI